MSIALSIKACQAGHRVAFATAQQWVDRLEGRRILSHAEIWNGDTLTAEADGIFVQPRPELAQEYWGDRPND